MSMPGQSVLKQLIEQGWLPNLVIAIFLLSLTEGSLWAIAASGISVVSFLTTSTLLQQDHEFYKVARRIVYTTGGVCLIAALFWCFEDAIRKKTPSYVVNNIESYVETIRRDGLLDFIEMPTPEILSARMIVGARGKELYRFAPADTVSYRIFADWFDKIDASLRVLMIMMLVTFTTTILIEKIARAIWASRKE